MKTLHLKPAKLNEEEQKLLTECNHIAALMAKRHNLSFQRIEPVETNDIWGLCSWTGILKLTFYKYLQTLDKPERWTINKSEVLRTLAHELAHLKEMNHGPKFWEVCNQFIREISEISGVKMKIEQNCYRRF